MKTIIVLASVLLIITSCKKNQEKVVAVPKVNIEKKEKTHEKRADKVVDTIKAGPVLGIDVSHFQGNVNWEEVKKSGIRFCYAKATQGNTYKDPKFNENKINTIKAGLLHGAYHFYVVGDDPKIQAKNFLSCLNIKITKDMLPMLDLEQGSLKGKVNVEQLQKDVLEWLKIIEEKLHIKPIIYTNNPFAKEYLQNPKFSEYKLWLAEYDVKQPRTPKPWKNWTIWQRSEKGFVLGAQGNIDHDILNKNLKISELTFSAK